MAKSNTGWLCKTVLRTLDNQESVDKSKILAQMTIT